MWIIIYILLYAVSLWVAMSILSIKCEFWRLIIIAAGASAALLIFGVNMVSTIVGIALIAGLTDADIVGAILAGSIAGVISMVVLMGLVLA